MLPSSSYMSGSAPFCKSSTISSVSIFVMAICNGLPSLPPPLLGFAPKNKSTLALMYFSSIKESVRADYLSESNSSKIDEAVFIIIFVYNYYYYN